MAQASKSGVTLWMWPFVMAKFTSDWTETMTSAVDVIATRLPVIYHAWLQPFQSDHQELSRMVTEKFDAFTLSHRSIDQARRRMQRHIDANSSTVLKATTGTMPGLDEWSEMLHRNMEIAAAFVNLPGQALAPVHARATANMRRLNGQKRKSAQ